VQAEPGLVVYVDPVTARPLGAETAVARFSFTHLRGEPPQDVALPPDLVVKTQASELGARARDEILLGSGLPLRYPRWLPPGVYMDQAYLCPAPDGTAVVFTFSGPGGWLAVVESISRDIDAGLPGTPRSYGEHQFNLVDGADCQTAAFLEGRVLITVVGRATPAGLAEFVAGLR
jgi:hypothetical protein